MIADDIASALKELVQETTTVDSAESELVNRGPETVLHVVRRHQWHSPDDCPPCLDEHCDDPDAHESGGGIAVLSEAVRILHTQAHNDPSDSLSAEQCMREPCASAPLGGTPPRHAFGALAGSR